MVPKGWEVKNLGDIATISSGGTPSRSQSEYWDGDIPWVTTTEVNFGTITNTAQKITQLGMQCSSAKLFPKNTILMAMYGQGKTRGQVAKLGIEATTNQACAAIIPKSGHSHEFLFQYLQAEYENIRSMSNGGGQNNLSAGLIKEIPVPVPPLAEQTKIAQILSTWDKAIATTERLLANSQQQKQALLGPLLSGQQRFAGYPEWVNTPIAKLLTESRLPGSNGELAKKITVKLYGNGVFAKDEKRIGSESTKYFTRKAGQFIYSKLDFLNGAFGIIPEHLDGYESTLDLPAFDFTEYVEPAWLVQYISREEFYSAQLGLANGGRKARRVNPADLLRIEIPLPSLPEQQKIAQVLSTADAEITNLQAQLTKLKLEKKALMQQLLTGQRRVRLDDELEEKPQIRVG